MPWQETDAMNERVRLVLVMDDGSITHEERRTPTNTERIDHPNLSSAELGQLTDWISAAELGSLAVSDGNPTNLGSLSGYLRVFGAGGSEIVIDSTCATPTAMASTTARATRRWPPHRSAR
jgi:hypothetical protein